MNELHCLIGVDFLVDSIYMSFIKNKEYENTLNDTQKEYYKKVVQERKQIYTQSVLYGLLGCLILFLFVERQSCMFDACFYTFTFFMIQYFVYTLLPKKKWMLDVVEDTEDAQQWLEKYKYMKRNWHYGLLLGVGAMLFLTLFLFENWDNDYAIIDTETIVVLTETPSKDSTTGEYLRDLNPPQYSEAMKLSDTPVVPTAPPQ